MGQDKSIVFNVGEDFYHWESNFTDAVLKSTYQLKCEHHKLPLDIEWLNNLTTEEVCHEFDLLVSVVIPSLKKS